MYDYFDRVYGFTQCDYKSYIDPNHKYNCTPCSKGSFSLDNNPTKCYSCDETVPDYLKEKQEFICYMESTGPNVPLIVFLSVLGLIIFVISVSIAILIK
jgi:hypothetical protein